MRKTEFQDNFSEEVWKSTYKDHTDTDVNDTFLRVARAVASVEATSELQAEWSDKFYDLLTDFKATCGGRIYANAGTEWKGTTLMNCFVGPHPKSDIDSLEGIYKILTDQAMTLKSEGGWGHNFSHIRPRGSFINGVGVESPGAVKFMEIFDKSSEIVTSGSGIDSGNKKAKGKIRKGAMMGVMDISHPDIMEFIQAKQTPGRLSKFNMSVNCTDAFMEKVLNTIQLKKDGVEKEKIDSADAWDLVFPDTTHAKYKTEWFGDIKDWKAKGYPVNVYRTVSATWLWNLIMDSTYNRAEPGILFLDRANYLNPLSYKETIFATNPCGEQTLAPGGVCNLISINLTQMVTEVGGELKFDYDKLEKYTRYAVRFADNVNSLSSAPLSEYEYSMKNKRRIGVGILGWGSLLYMLNHRFAGYEASILRDNVMRRITQSAIDCSVELAKEKGMFSECDPKQHANSPYFKQVHMLGETYNKMLKYGIRNSSLFSIQPTGNTGIFANIVSGGLEPIFMQEYIRTVIVQVPPTHLLDVTPKYWEGTYHETEFFKTKKEGDEEILRGVDKDGTVYKIDKNRGLTKEVLCEDYGVRYLKARGKWDANADWAVSTSNLLADDHISDLTGFSRWMDSAVSKTINIPNDYQIEDFKNVYLNAYKSGVIKGVTTYRAGTMTTVLSAKVDTVDDDVEIILENADLPDASPAVMKTLRAEGRKWYIHVVLNESQTKPFAIFAHTNNTEKNVTTSDAVERLLLLAIDKKLPLKYIEETEDKMAGDNNVNKLARAISLLLRHGVLIKNIVGELDKVPDVFVGSFLFQIKKYLSGWIKDGEKIEGESCGECGSTQIVYSEGCKKCSDCGAGKCS